MIPFHFLSFCSQAGFLLLFAKRHLADPRATDFSIHVQKERESLLIPCVEKEMYLSLNQS